MKFKYLIMLSVGMLVLLSCNQETKLEKAYKGKIKKEVVSVAPKVPGRILKLYVEESAVVKKGDTLAVLDVPEVEAKLQQARGALLAAENQYRMALRGATKNEREQVEAMYTAAEEQYGLAEKTYERLEQMYADSLISAQKYDETVASYKRALAQKNAAEAKRQEVVSGVRTEKVLMAKGDLQRAQGALQEAEVASQERYLLAPADMTIETIALQAGELALPGYNIFTGYLQGSTYFRFTVPESEVNQFKTGTKKPVLLAYADQQYEAELTGIKQLTSYASRTTPFPEYELGEALYELKWKPVQASQVADLITNQTILMRP